MKHGGSCSEKDLIDVQTNRSKRKFADIQQDILHDTTAGSMPPIAYFWCIAYR